MIEIDCLNRENTLVRPNTLVILNLKYENLLIVKDRGSTREFDSQFTSHVYEEENSIEMGEPILCMPQILR
jgi:hypothetical protein